MDPGEDEVAKFNRARSDANVVLKLGLYAGSCIAGLRVACSIISVPRSIPQPG